MRPNAFYRLEPEDQFGRNMLLVRTSLRIGDSDMLVTENSIKELAPIEGIDRNHKAASSLSIVAIRATEKLFNQINIPMLKVVCVLKHDTLKPKDNTEGIAIRILFCYCL
jgi:hypothetical protein